jgi:KaiC/GvpD/RAD55 family RecA-like ATPase
MTTTKTPVPDVSDDPHAFLDAVANDLGERVKPDLSLRLDAIVSRLPDAFGSTSFRARPTPFLFWATDPDGESPAVPVIPRGRVVLLTGQGGTGKSHLSLTFAVGLAAGVPVGSFYVRSQDRDSLGRGRSLVVFGEETPDEVEARLDAVCRTVRFKTSSSGDEWQDGLNDDRRALVRDRVEYIAGCGRDLRLTDSESETRDFADDLAHRIKTAADDGDPYALVVLDPMTRFNGADENDNAAAARLVTILEQLTNDTRTTVIAVHHSGKGETAATNARGASALVDNARCQLALQRGPGLSVLTIEKSNYGPLSAPNGRAPRFWLGFHKAPDAAVYTLQELDKAQRKVARATAETARIQAKVEAKEAKERDDALVAKMHAERKKQAKSTDGAAVQSDDDATVDAPQVLDSDPFNPPDPASL